jgi:Tol biopolymer transport system component/DNA-binding winged helix-turn-helix (wHTH) protein
LRFGVYEADVAACELRKSGVRIRLTGQPFQVLVLLLERDGGIVTREELRDVLWHDGTVVDFDRCLNTVINKLRETLGDSAETPRFVETMPRRGYRFLLPVQREFPEPPEPLAAPERPVVAVEPRPALVREAASQRRLRRNQSRWQRPRWMIPMALGALAIAGLAALALWWSPATPTANPSFALLPLTRFPGSEITPTFSPDGQHVAFAWNGEPGGGLNLYLSAVGPGEPQRITNTASSDFSPAYSPHGDQLAFYRRSGDSAAIYLISPQGGTPVRLMGLRFGPPDPLTTPNRSAEQLSWSPDGKYLAYVDRPSPEAPYSIFLRSIESRDDRGLTLPPEDAYGDGSPALSPDGRSLAFVRHDGDGSADVYLTSLVEGGLRQITGQGCPIFGLTWDPHGAELIYSSACDGPPGLRAVALSGGMPRRFAAAVGVDVVEPSLSLTGGRLSYVRRGRGASLRRVAFVMSATRDDPPRQGEKLEDLPPGAVTAHYSPDGRRIVFAANRAGKGEIWTAAAAGGDSTMVVSAPALVGSPNWSPDGSRILFDSMAGGNWDICLVDAKGGEPLRLTTHDGMDARPSWSRDGQWIYFSSDRSGASEIWRARPDGNHAVRLTAQGGYEAYESLDGTSLYYTRRGISGLWKVSVARGEETLEIPDLPWEYSRNWTITDRGILYSSPHPESPAVTEFRLFNPASGQTTSLLNLEARLDDAALSASPDGQWLLYSQKEELETDIEVMGNLD